MAMMDIIPPLRLDALHQVHISTEQETVRVTPAEAVNPGEATPQVIRRHRLLDTQTDRPDNLAHPNFAMTAVISTVAWMLSFVVNVDLRDFTYSLEWLLCLYRLIS